MNVMKEIEIKEKLPEDFKKQWVEALRSGKYKQGHLSLYSPYKNTYCCLGVACKTVDVPDEQMAAHMIPHKDFTNGDKLPAILLTNNDVVRFLWNINDGQIDYNEGKWNEGWSFRQIADWIEKNL